MFLERTSAQMEGGHLYSYLCTWKGGSAPSKKVVRVRDKKDVVPTAMQMFNIGPGVSVTLRLFDEEFEEYVDVEKTEDLPQRGKLQLAPSDTKR